MIRYMLYNTVHTILKRRGRLFSTLSLLLLMLTWGAGPAFAQTDYSGTYYIATVGYDNNPNNTNNFYLCPTEGWAYYKPTDDFSSDGTTYPNPFLTSYKVKAGNYDATEAVWIIRKNGDEDYYYIIQKSTGKYLMANGQIRTSNNANRIRVHLEAVPDPNDLDDKALFALTSKGSYFVISSKSSVGWNGNDYKWLTVNGGNKNYLTGQSGKGDGPSGFSNTAGVVGIYTETDVNAPFYLEDLLTRPTIQYNDQDLIEIIPAQSGDNIAIYYTLDNSKPTTTKGTLYNGAFNPAPEDNFDGGVIVKAIVVVNGDSTNVTTFTTPVLCGPTHKRLIQNQNNAWTDAQENAHYYFYMIPGDEVNNVLKVNTTSMFRPTMEWYFK